MRTFNDENAQVNGPLPKTIHQRNKSSPALSSAANHVALKTTTRRTAFGDVSNIAGMARAIKEDPAFPSKPQSYTQSKVARTIHETKSAALLRPAQRPLSVSSLKSFLSGSSGNSQADNSSKASLNEVLPQQNTHVRKTIARRNTTIFKDVQLDTVQEIDHSDPQKAPTPGVNLEQYKGVTPDVLDVQQDPQLHLPPPSTIMHLIEPVKTSEPEPVQGLTQIYNEDIVNNMPLSDKIESSVTLKEEPTTEPSISQPGIADAVEHPLELVPEEEPEFTTAVKRIETQLTAPVTGDDIKMPLVPLSQPQIMPSLMKEEAEEYWEEDDEAYEEEGYVTARSFRSKGDNTTGGATTLLVPRMNQQARREIEAATKLVEATRTVEEIEDENFDTSMVAEYGDEIFEYMRQLEVKMSPNPHYMDNQHEIQWSMRAVLMDWLVQVHHRFNLLPETLFLCANYIDRFLSCKVVSLGKLQLVGATAIFIAAKYEEINCPSVQEIVYMVDGGYTVDEILKAERFMLTMLQFELGWPGPMSFLRRISKADDYDLETRTLAKYFLEVTLMDERFIGSPPSFAAAASHCLARMMLRKGSWVRFIPI